MKRSEGAAVATTARDDRSGQDVAVLAVDVGNSKTDVALVGRSGDVFAVVRGPTASHQQVGAEAGFRVLVQLADQAAAAARIDPVQRPLAELVAYCGAGADFRSDVALLTRGVRATGLGAGEIVANDCWAGLRAGTSRTWGICVICGSGMNCLGVAPSGRVARFDSLGVLSGDWGGGGAVGQAGLAAAVRSQDGRGPATLLATTVPAHFGVARPRLLAAAMYRGTIPFARHLEIAPLVFEAAACDDAVARAIVDRLANEVVAWASAAVRRLRLGRLDPDVVLAGGVFRTHFAPFYERIEAGIREACPGARVMRLTSPPVAGAALLGLDRLLGRPVPEAVERRLRTQLTDDRLLPG